MNRIERIANFATRRDDAAKSKELQQEQEMESLRKRITDLKPRIVELIQTANACLEHGIDIKRYITNSISHEVGFAQDWAAALGLNTVIAMGINAGGACGRLDFRTNGADSYFVNEKDRTQRETPSPETAIRYMTRFTTEFNAFEGRPAEGAKINALDFQLKIH